MQLEPEQRDLNIDVLSRAVADVTDNALSSRLTLHCYYHLFLILKGQLSGRVSLSSFLTSLRFFISKK